MNYYRATQVLILNLITMTTTTVLSVTPSVTDCFNSRSSSCRLPPNLGNQVILQIQHAKINNIPAGIFREYGQVKTLDLAYNNISNIDPGAFVGLVSMTKLLLLSNGIENVRYTTFAGAEKLRFLSLAQNKIRFIEPGSFDGLRKLMLLNLNANKLTRVPPGIYDGSPHLHYLYMDGNQIRTISPTAFQSLTQLKILRMNRNRLENIPDIFGDVLKLTRLGISRNPFQCDCRMEYFRRWMAAHGSMISTLIKEPVQCTAPANLAGKDLRFEKTVLRCTRPFLGQSQRPVSVIEGAQKIIRPQVEGQPAPSLNWLSPSGSSIPVIGSNSDPSALNVRELRETERVAVDESGSLVIKRATVEDSGIYTCKATNVAGTFSFTVDISVQKKEEGATTVSMTTPALRDDVYGKWNEQTAFETEADVLKECFNSHEMMFKVVFLSCLITFLLTSLLFALIFCCYQKRAATRTKTFFGQFEPTPERHRMRFAKSTCESGSSLRTALTRLSALSFGSDIEYAPGSTAKRGQLNDYCTGSETMVRQFSLSAETGKHSNGDEGNCATYEHPYVTSPSKTCGLPNPPKQEDNEMEGYMIPMEAKSNTIIPTRNYQNSSVCTFDPNYATIDPIALRRT